LRWATKRRLAGVAALACLALAGCGDDGGGEPATTESAVADVSPAEFAIYDWEGNLVPRPGAPNPAAQGFARRSDAEQLAASEPGAIVVAEESQSGREQFFVLRDRPGVTAVDITDPEAIEDPTIGAPSVGFGFTPEGQRKFQDMTREVVQRAKQRAGPGVSGLDTVVASEHIAFVVDGTVLSLAVIDFGQFPDGIDGKNGAQISGGFTRTEANELAERLAPER
jgi:preprotein translocase subunit SecD